MKKHGFRFLVAGFMVVLLSGCATKSYVKQQCWEARRNAREYTRDQKLECLQYTADVDTRVDWIDRGLLRSWK